MLSTKGDGPDSGRGFAGLQRKILFRLFFERILYPDHGVESV